MTPSEPGFFISVEGLDGSGKTTQVGLLAQALSQRGQTVKVVRDPGSTDLGERIRDLLLEPGGQTGLDRWAEAALFLASRTQLEREVIAPALARGEVVVSDRYLDSSLVYQGARGIPWESLLELHGICGVDRLPDLTLILDLPVEMASQRRSRRSHSDRMEAQDNSYHMAVRAGYLEVARRFADRAVVLRADRGASELADECQRVALERLTSRRPI